jgi:hypothetical protein
VRIVRESGVSVSLTEKEARTLARVLQGIGVPTDDREAEAMRLDLVDGLHQHLFVARERLGG